MAIRSKPIPGKLSEQELRYLHEQARAAGYQITAQYVRKRLKLPQVREGAPEGNQNARGERRSAPTGDTPDE